MDVLAVGAAAAQLAVYAIKLTRSASELKDRIRNAPRRFAQHAQHIELLVIIARDIGNNKVLQSPTIGSLLSATLVETEAAQIILDRFLNDSRKRRYFGVINGKFERNIIEHLDNLDRTVHAFCLYYVNSMATTQAEFLSRHIDRRLQPNTEPIAVAREVVPYRSRSLGLGRNRKAKRRPRKDHKPKPSMEKATMPGTSVNSTKGSQVHSNFRLEDVQLFCIGHGTDGKTHDPTPAPKITFSKFHIRKGYGFHIGVVGQPSGDSTFDSMEVVGSEGFHIGPYSSSDARMEDLRKLKDVRKSIPR